MLALEYNHALLKFTFVLLKRVFFHQTGRKGEAGVGGAYGTSSSGWPLKNTQRSSFSSIYEEFIATLKPCCKTQPANVQSVFIES